MLRRQHAGEFHAYPEHRTGGGGVLRRVLWRLGFDPLTVYERLAQVRQEAADWKRWLYEYAIEKRAGITDEERGGLTVWGDTISAQIRDEHLVLHVREDAPRSTEDGHPVLVSPSDARKLRALLVEAEHRGQFPSDEIAAANREQVRTMLAGMDDPS